MLPICSLTHCLVVVFFLSLWGFSVNGVAQQDDYLVVRPLAGSWIPTYSFGVYEQDYFCGDHLGNDIPRPAGTRVYAIADGTVTRAEDTDKLGKSVHILHNLPNGDLTSVYYHLRRESEGGKILNEDQPVLRGEYIGEVTENEDDNFKFQHLHFGIRAGNFRYDYEFDDRTHKWFYPGYTSIFLQNPDCKCDTKDQCYNNGCYTLRQCHKIGIALDKTDPKHSEILSEWLDPADFLALKHDPLTPDNISTTFAIGDTVKMKEAGVTVRDTPFGISRGIQSDTKVLGDIVSDQDYTVPWYSHPYWWWKVDFESGADGWVAEEFLKPAGGGGGNKTILSEGWETLALGYPRCEVSVEGYTNCGFTADSGQWHVGEYTDVIPVGDRLTSVQIISGKRVKIGKANGFGGFLSSPRTPYPLVPGMTLSFTDHDADLGASNTTSWVMMRVIFEAPGPLPCPGTDYSVGNTSIEYILEREAGADLSNSIAWPCTTVRINVGKVNSLSRDLYKDFKDYLPFDPNGWRFLEVKFNAIPGDGADPSLWATFDNIKVTVP